jgi:predicted secreted Zn-dependent protease
MFRESFLIFTALCLFTTSTLAKDISAVVPYHVQGKTAAEVYAFIKTKSPRVANNATFAFTMIATKTDKRENPSRIDCHYSTFKTSAIFNFILPKHAQPSDLPSKTRAKWLAFENYLQMHEQGHRGIWQKCFAEYDAAAQALSAKDCKALDKLREQTFTQVKKGCLKLDENHDVAFRKEVLTHPFVVEALAKPKP